MKVVQAFTSFTHQSLLIAFIYPSVHFYCGWRLDLNLVLLGVLRQQHILVCNRVLNKADNDMYLLETLKLEEEPPALSQN